MHLLNYFLFFGFICTGFCDNHGCNFSTFEVQSNFDVNKYVGKWYEIQWLAQSYIPENELFRDYQHHYVLENNGNITAYIKGRDPISLQTCFDNEAHLLQTGTPGKLLYKRKINDTAYITSDYWVVLTDYDNFAVVYGCRIPFLSGTCDEADSWIWSRSRSLSQKIWNQVNQKIDELCLKNSSYLKTSHENECTDCRSKLFDVQEDFNLGKYLGKWYEMQWLAQSYIPENELFRDYQHHYVLENNGNITAYIKGRDPSNFQTCFRYDAQLLQTNTPGKFLYKRKFNDTDYITSDYWVVMTDYDNFAVVYGCRIPFPNGTCNEADSWIWSRTKSLPPQIWDQINQRINQLCLNSSFYLKTIQDTECPDCRVRLFEVQKNFDASKYAGKWYEMQWLAHSYISESELFRDYTHHYIMEGNGTLSAYIKGRDPVDLKTCFNNQAQLIPTGTPGKFIYTRKYNATHMRTSDYWVVMTDYDNFAVVYGCRVLFDNGTCDRADSWIWSRRQTMSYTVWNIVNKKIKELCLDTSSYLKTAHENECKECRYKLFDVQEKFELEKYLGKWYEMQWLAQSYIPENELFRDYQHHYYKERDGNITIYIKGRDPSDTETCFSNEAQIIPTSTPGKLLFRRKINDTAYITSDYWVVMTDYDNYAVVYGCRIPFPNGTCDETDSWIWSRSSSLTLTQWSLIDEKIIALCVSPTSYLTTSQTHECKECRFILFPVQTDFDITKYTGSWFQYQLYHLEDNDDDMDTQTNPQIYHDYQHMYTMNQYRALSVHIKGRMKSRGQCFYQDAELQVTSTPGKFAYVRRTDPMTQVATDYWVMKTDYANYAIVYGCRKSYDNGTCQIADVSVLCRYAIYETDPNVIRGIIDEKMEDLCMEGSHSSYTPKTRDCPEEPKDCPVQIKCPTSTGVRVQTTIFHAIYTSVFTIIAGYLMAPLEA